jgi:cytochrome c-type protein NapB
MKIISKLGLSIVTAAAIFVVGCSASQNSTKAKNIKTVSEESLGLRTTNLYVEDANTYGDATKYGNKPAGTSTKIARAFQDAPPMIPHDVEGMLPITIKDNQCISCHAPAVAASMGATPYPVSHMTNFRPTGSYAISGINTSSESLAHISIQKGGKLVGARFNCSQCHAPQSTVSAAPENTFKAVYSNPDGASKSSWNGTRLMDGIDTTK